MKVTNQILIKCINKDGADLKTYYDWEPIDESQYARLEGSTEHYNFNDIVTVDPEKHNYSGNGLTDFKLDLNSWELLEVSKAYQKVLKSK